MANYIAKYATKSLTAPGLPDRRIRTTFDVNALRCSAHFKRMIVTAWQLGSKHATGDPRLRQWAHMLGYGGHFLTKCRRLLRHLRRNSAPPAPSTAAPSATPMGNATPGAAPSTKPPSSSWPAGPTPEPAIRHRAPAQNWRSPRLTWHVAASQIGGSPSTRS